ncbi:MAG: ion transporter, partial [Duncaniella sp.]|nr:ion transporter [Duncaniella sp.]
ALIGGFNYISRECGESAPYSSVFLPDLNQPVKEYAPFAADLERLVSRPGAWSFTLIAASGALEPEYPEHLHFGAGGKRGDETFDGDDLLVKDMETYRQLYDDVSRLVKEEMGLVTDHQRRYDTSNRRMVQRHINAPEANHVVLRLEWDKILWDPRRMMLAVNLARSIKRVIEGKELDPPASLKVKDIGYKGYDI